MAEDENDEIRTHDDAWICRWVCNNQHHHRIIAVIIARPPLS